MKKVVMFSGPQHEIPPTKGAAVQTWIYEVSKRLLTYQTHIISIAHDFLPHKEFHDGIYFHRIHMSKLYKRVFQKILGWDCVSYNVRVFQIIQKIHPNIVHIHNYPEGKEIVSWIKNFDPSIKVILHMHNQSTKFDIKKDPQVDHFIGCSDYIVDYYKKTNLINTALYTTLYNGVDIKKFDEATLNKDAIKKFLHIEKNVKNIFYFGRISEEKGVEEIVKIALLFQENSSFKFYCVGEIATSGGRYEYYKSLQETINHHKLTNIEFLDYISPDKIHLAYQLADLIIVPSKFEEPFCMVAIEAMASHVPVIAVSKGGLKEYLINSHNAILIDNYENFAKQVHEKITTLFSDPELYSHLSINGYKTVTENFNWINIAQKVENVYNEK